MDESKAHDQAENKSHFHWGKAGILFSTVAIIISICAFLYGFFQLGDVNVSLARLVSSLKTQTEQNTVAITGLKQSVDQFQSIAMQSQAITTKQEKIMADWDAAEKGNLDKWRVAEAQYLVRLANDQLLLNNEVTIAKTLLTRASDVLAQTNDQALATLKKAIADDLTKLAAAPSTEVSTVYQQLITLNNILDQLPLPSMPLQPEAVEASIIDTSNLSWWERGLKRTGELLRQIVIIRHNTGKAAPLVMPEEKVFLYQNMHAQMDAAMWAVLHRNTVVYQASLKQVIDWVQHYFIADAETTKSVLQQLDDLQKINLESTTVNLAATLPLFNQYLSPAAPAESEQTAVTP